MNIFRLTKFLTFFGLLFSLNAFAGGPGKYGADFSISHESAKNGEEIQIKLSNVNLPENGFIRINTQPEEGDGSLLGGGARWILPDTSHKENGYLYYYQWIRDDTATFVPDIYDIATNDMTWITLRVNVEMVIFPKDGKGRTKFKMLHVGFVTIYR